MGLIINFAEREVEIKRPVKGPAPDGKVRELAEG
ncbi:MAG: hypothetical protein ACE5HO_12510 [bacterium]